MKQPETASPQAAKFFETNHEFLGELWARWQDEHEYEDINDYKLPLQREADKFGVTITKMHKRPFGCTFKVNERGHDHKVYQIKVTGTKCSFLRIA